MITETTKTEARRKAASLIMRIEASIGKLRNIQQDLSDRHNENPADWSVIGSLGHIANELENMTASEFVCNVSQGTNFAGGHVFED
tara:strand:- start:1614 stop:1871 length:258 start_codon:yes stop_codon:yes gene_type:complete